MIGRVGKLSIEALVLGKTLLAQTIAKCLDVPFAICDCTTLTQAGTKERTSIESQNSKSIHV